MSDEVSDFLRSVELLKGRREEEDEARSRELEEKILQEKRERQARRAGTQSPPSSNPLLLSFDRDGCVVAASLLDPVQAFAHAVLSAPIRPRRTIAERVE
jgi:hypothetical protein